MSCASGTVYRLHECGATTRPSEWVVHGCEATAAPSTRSAERPAPHGGPGGRPRAPGRPLNAGAQPHRRGDRRRRWAAAWSPGRSRSWAASPASASRPCCSRRWPPWPPAVPPACTSRPRSRAPRWRCGPSASASLAPRCGWWPRPAAHVLDHIEATVGPTCWSSTRSRRSTTPSSSPPRARSARCGTAPTGWSARPRPGGHDDDAGGPRHQGGGARRPRVLEHLVDTVLSFEGERHHALRLLRAVKHRFGGTHELGLFEMGEAGLAGVPDPSGCSWPTASRGVAGVGGRPVLDGQRPLLVEVQALVVPSPGPLPRRTAQGVDGGRLAQVLAVLERHAGLALGRSEVHVAVAAACGCSSPASDLAVALAVASSATGRPLPRAWWPAARWGWAASCARSSAPTAGWPRPPGSASAAALVPTARPTTAGPHPGCGAGRPHPSRGGGRFRRRHRGRRRAAGQPLRGGPPSPPADGGSNHRMAHRAAGHARGSPVARPAPSSHALAAVAPARRCARASTASCRPAWARSSSSATARGAQHLLGRLPARRRLQPPAAVRAGQDGRRHHPGQRRQPHRPGQRPPGAQPQRADVRDRHPAPHGRARGPLDRRAGDLGLRGHDGHRHLRGRREAPARADPPGPADPGQPGPPDARALPQPARRRRPRCPPSRSRTW